MDFFSWSDDREPARRIPVSSVADWQNLYEFYTEKRGNAALLRIIEIAASHGVRSILAETRYLDADWRSEHGEFYSTTYARYPSVAHRLHFFARDLPSDLSDLSGMSPHYVGYSIMRPLPAQPVGRTMLKPPPELHSSVRCEAVETVDILGWPMKVCGMPFISQDAQYLRCAHADIWMGMRHAYLLNQVSRKTSAQVHASTMGGVVAGREIPSDGLSIQQMLSGMTALGLSPGLISLPPSKADSDAAGHLSLFAIVCRYVNSNIAPIIASSSHVWMIVAYNRHASAAHTGLTLYRHDDARGPYIRVDDPWNEPSAAHQPWGQALLPLPPKIYMAAERAEAIGEWWFDLRIKSLPPTDPLAEAAGSQSLAFSTYGVGANQYKEALQARAGIDASVASRYRLSLWPRNLWIIEAVDRRLRSAGERCVLGEVIIDPTATQYPSPKEPGIIAAHAPGLLWSITPDTKEESTETVGALPYQTGRPQYTA